MRPGGSQAVRTGGPIALGRYGEELATQHLVEDGLCILDRNWRCRWGELDVVAAEPDGRVVFVEVKTRSSATFGDPAEAVTAAKARRLRRLAVAWLAERPRPGRSGLRFDVICVLLVPRAQPEVRHLREAF